MTMQVYPNLVNTLQIYALDSIGSNPTFTFIKDESIKNTNATRHFTQIEYKSHQQILLPRTLTASQIMLNNMFISYHYTFYYYH